MKKLSLRSVIMLFIAAIFVLGLCIFCGIYVSSSADWTTYQGNHRLYSNGEFVGAGKITDIAGTTLAETKDGKRIYNSSYTTRISTLHAVGDTRGFINTGVQSAFREKLSGYNLFTGLFGTNTGYCDMQLTINADVSAAALNALGNHAGTVGLYNYKTGELLCMVSSPTFDVNNAENIYAAQGKGYEGVFINRFLGATYAPGSTFKIVTAMAAVETFSDAYTRTYNCKGECTIGGEQVKCTGYHGDIKLEKAFAVSCNCYFSQLAVDLGKKTMTRYAEKFGFNKKYYLEGMPAAVSSYDVGDARTIQLGWSGIGQYNDMQNPLQYLTSVGGVANGGTPIKPYFIKKIKNAYGITTYRGGKQSGTRVCSKDTAEKLEKLMRGAVEITYGAYFFGDLTVCGKTGTAEVDKRIPHAEFVGFCTDEEYPFAFIVVAEEGGSGNDLAKSIANSTLQAAKRYYDSKE